MDQRTVTHVQHEYVQEQEAAELHKVDVWLPGPTAGVTAKATWVIYLHGGAWRDPEIDSLGLKPAIDILLAGTLPVAGFASINYRLSPYPTHDRKPSSPDDPSRNVRHPDHILDVSRALAYLDDIYQIGDGYMLVGHSCGATLAFQLELQYERSKVPQPSCIIGSEGIYDLHELLNTHTHPAYRSFVEGAFGSEETVWATASPYSMEKLAAWATAKVLIISHSEDDELVDKNQADLMLERVRSELNFHGRVLYIATRGNHDDIWEKGSELARLITTGLDLM